MTSAERGGHAPVTPAAVREGLGAAGHRWPVSPAGVCGPRSGLRGSGGVGFPRRGRGPSGLGEEAPRHASSELWGRSAAAGGSSRELRPDAQLPREAGGIGVPPDDPESWRRACAPRPALAEASGITVGPLVPPRPPLRPPAARPLGVPSGRERRRGAGPASVPAPLARSPSFSLSPPGPPSPLAPLGAAGVSSARPRPAPHTAHAPHMHRTDQVGPVALS